MTASPYSSGAVVLPAGGPASPAASRRMVRAGVCLGLFAALALWAYFWPQTGDGDAIMHFQNARDGLWEPAKLLGSWARVGAKLPLLIPAQLGLYPARLVSAVISVLAAWQTMRLADDLGMANATLAGPLLIFQPQVFVLAADTMTELPFALVLVIAIRLWWSRRPLASSLVASYLPLIRPEGFFICLLWGLMLVHSEFFKDGRGRKDRRTPPSGRRLLRKFWATFAVGCSLTCGTAAWLIACRLLQGQWTPGWAWPADSSSYYGQGSFFHHFALWPAYCGPVLLVLFLIGCASVLGKRFWAIWALVVAVLARLNSFLSWHLRAASYGGTMHQALADINAVLGYRDALPLAAMALVLIVAMGWAWRREKIALPWAIFLMIFTLHSILWWRGWFGSCGLMRILAVVAPVTAVICLRGWNAASRWLNGRRLSQPWRRVIGAACLSAIVAAAAISYAQDPSHYRVFALQRACSYLRSRDLVRGAPMLLLGDPMAAAELNLPPNLGNLSPDDCNRLRECGHFLAAPIGTVGLWDNQHAHDWFHVNISDLAGLGFDVLDEEDQTVHCRIAEWLGRPNATPLQRYVVIRKTRPGKMPADAAEDW